MNIPHPIIGSYPVRTGNAVRPLVDGRRIGEVIDRARHSVWLTVALYAPWFAVSVIGIVPGIVKPSKTTPLSIAAKDLMRRAVTS